MLTRRVLLGALLAAALMGGALPTLRPPPVAAATQPPQLAGTNVLVGSKTTSIRVVVPADATFLRPDLLRRKSVRVRGNGGLVGFVLAEDTPDKDGFSFIAGRIRRAEGGYEKFSHILNGEEAGRVRIPAGTYRLYLLTDGAPVRVVFDLAGLTGRTRLEPTRRHRYKIASPKQRILPAEEGVYTAGGAGTLRTPGLLFNIHSVERKLTPEVLITDCLYIVDGDFTEPSDDQPFHCVGADITFNFLIGVLDVTSYRGGLRGSTIVTCRVKRCAPIRLAHGIRELRGGVTMGATSFHQLWLNL